MGSAAFATGDRGTCISTAKIAVEVALDGHAARAGPDCFGSGRFDRALDPLHETRYASANGSAVAGVACGLSTRKATGASGRCRRAKMSIRKIVLLALAVTGLCATSFAESKRLLGGSAGG